MKTVARVLLLSAFAFSASAGTLIYKNREGRTLTASGLKIFSIDSQKMVVKINEGTETIPLSRVVKYYDTDIKLGGSFDDNTAEYDIRLDEGVIREERKKNGPKNGQKIFEIPFDVVRKSARMDTPMRFPYIFLFVLTSNSEGNRSIHSYGFPASAKLSLKNYDEARMLEKVLSLKRPHYYREDVNRLGVRSSGTRMGGRIATFQLNNLKDRKIIAWYVVAWSKDSISAVREWRDGSYRIGKNWWIR